MASLDTATLPLSVPPSSTKILLPSPRSLESEAAVIVLTGWLVNAAPSAIAPLVPLSSRYALLIPSNPWCLSSIYCPSSSPPGVPTSFNSTVFETVLLEFTSPSKVLVTVEPSACLTATSAFNTQAASVPLSGSAAR